jgi:uncharacterized membrane protein
MAMRQTRPTGEPAGARAARPGADAQPRDGWAGRDRQQRRPQDLSAEQIARGLGWFSLALGAPQVTAPGGFARFIGAPDNEETRTIVRTVVGMRELAAGAGILTRPRPAGVLWARVAGDAMDLALLGMAFTSRGAKRDRLAVATAGVVGVTVLDVYCALQLSRQSGMTVGRARGDHGIRVKKAITVNRPPEDVYRFWHDFQNLPRFMDHLESVQTTGDRRSHWKAKAPAGRPVEWDAEVVDDRPNELIAWRSLDGADVPNSGVVRFQPAPGDRGTEVRVELEYTPPGGPVGATIAKLFGEEPDQQVGEDLRHFKQVMEAGEVVFSEATVHDHPYPARPPDGHTERLKG